MTEDSLSNIIRAVPKFWFFNELLPIPSEESVLEPHDFIKINKIVDDIGLYLKELQSTFNRVNNLDIQDISWYLEGKEGVIELHNNMASVDTIISKLLIVLDSPDNSKHLQFNHLLNKFEETSDLLFDVKKSLIVMKKKVDIAINCHELTAVTISSLISEVDECLKVSSRLKMATKANVQSPTSINTYSVHELVHKMQLPSPNNYSTKSLVLPTFSQEEDSIYDDYLTLDSRIQPLDASMSFLPLRIEEFLNMSNGQFRDSLVDVRDKFDTLLEKWNQLLEENRNFKQHYINKKWNEMLTYLVQEVTKIVRSLVSDFEAKSDKKITKKVGESYKLCSNSITIIKKAVKGDVLGDPQLIFDFNEKLINKWNRLNELLMSNQRFDDISIYTSNEFTGLKSFQTTRVSSSPTKRPVITSPVKGRSSSDSILGAPGVMLGHSYGIAGGLGIDLGIDVENSKFPISVKNTSKIRDFQKEYGVQKSAKPSLLLEFKLTEESENFSPTATDSEATIAHAFTNLKITDNFIEQVSKRRPGFKSKIPRVVPDFGKKGYKPVPKVDSKGSKIPTIALTHPAFQSPAKSPDCNSDYKSYSPRELHSPIVFQKPRTVSRSISGTRRTQSSPQRSPTPRSRYGLDTYDELDYLGSSRRVALASRASSISLVSPPLNLGQTPNLSHPETTTSTQHSPVFNSPVSYRSTSPERPGSSIGSRFDDEHLLQPLKHLKPAWK